jgi:hypothetical protein
MNYTNLLAFLINGLILSNTIYRVALGYDAIETKNFGLHDDIQRQIVALQPNAVNLIAKINNPAAM